MFLIIFFLNFDKNYGFACLSEIFLVSRNSASTRSNRFVLGFSSQLFINALKSPLVFCVVVCYIGGYGLILLPPVILSQGPADMTCLASVQMIKNLAEPNWD